MCKKICLHIHFIISNLFTDSARKNDFVFVSSNQEMICPTNTYIVRTPPYQLCILCTHNSRWLCEKRRRKMQSENIVESWYEEWSSCAGIRNVSAWMEQERSYEGA